MHMLNYLSTFQFNYKITLVKFSNQLLKLHTKRLTTSTISQLLINERTSTVDFILKEYVLRLFL